MVKADDVERGIAFTGPFLGIVAQNGYVEAYDYETAEKYDFHHSYALSPQGQKYYDDDGTLRFVKYFGDNKYTLEGSPALDPFKQGSSQIQIFARYCVKEVPRQTPFSQ